MSIVSALLILYIIRPDSVAPSVLIVLPAGTASIFISYVCDLFLLWMWIASVC